MRRSRTIVFLLTAAVVVATGALAYAGKWAPFEFKGAAYYKYRITQHEDDGQTTIVYAFEAKPNPAATAGGELWQVTTTTQMLVKKDELDGRSMFGASPLLTLVPMLAMGNPIFAGLLGQMELKVGEKMSFMGMGVGHVVSMETVAGIEGYLCNLFITEDGVDKKIAELVVHPDHAFPLRSRSFEDGEVQFEMELLEYRKP